VWQEHLTPLLSAEKEAAGLRCVCKALKAVVREVPVKLKSRVDLAELEAALTCFPATTKIRLESPDAPLEAAEESRLVELLRGHGGTFTCVDAWRDAAERLFFLSVQAGALPNLKYFEVNLYEGIHRQILSGGVLRLLEEVGVTVCLGEHVAALEHVQHLPYLRRLMLVGSTEEVALRFPPFVPPSLKSLGLVTEPSVHLESLLRELPSVLQASGATLEEFELTCTPELPVEYAAALAQVLCTCSWWRTRAASAAHSSPLCCRAS
jgi:hypothetical protein